jgi:hypothetical protein
MKYVPAILSILIAIWAWISFLAIDGFELWKWLFLLLAIMWTVYSIIDWRAIWRSHETEDRPKGS